jgi:hypothetical protein
MLNFSKWFLNEMPIQLKTLGNWEDDKKYRWDKPSIGILTNPVGVQKITQKWSRLPQQFNAWMLKGPGASKYVEVGEVDESFLTNNLKLKIVPNPTKPDEINIDPNAINVIYTQNIGNEKVPMNYWTIAHRFGHTVRRKNQTFDYFTRELEKDVLNLMQSVFGRQPSKNTMYGQFFDSKGRQFLKQFANALGTMGSARKGQLRDFGEFPYELLAQYMLTGKITFNRLPFKIVDRYAWGKPQHIRPQWALKQDDFEQWNDFIVHMEEKYQQLLEEILESSVGKIFIM